MAVRRRRLEGRLGLRPPHPRPPLPAARPARRSGRGPGVRPMTTDYDTPGPPTRYAAPLGCARSASPPSPVLLGRSSAPFLAWTWTQRFPGDLTVYGTPAASSSFALLLGPASPSRSCSAYRGPAGSRPADWHDAGPRAARPRHLRRTWFMAIVLLLIAVELGGLVNLDPGGVRRPRRRASLRRPVGCRQLHADVHADQAAPAQRRRCPGLGRDPRHRRRCCAAGPVRLAPTASAPEDGSVFVGSCLRRPLGTASAAGITAGLFDLARVLTATAPPRSLMLGGVRRRVLLPVHPGQSDANMSIATHILIFATVAPRPEHRRRPRRPARPRLRRLPRRRRLRRRPRLRLGVRHSASTRRSWLAVAHRRLRLGLAFGVLIGAPTLRSARRLPRHRHPRLRGDLPHRHGQPRRQQRARTSPTAPTASPPSPTSTSSGSTSASRTTSARHHRSAGSPTTTS